MHMAMNDKKSGKQSNCITQSVLHNITVLLVHYTEVNNKYCLELQTTLKGEKYVCYGE